MNHTIKLLDSYRDVCSLPSDNQVALKLGVTRGTVSNWRKERNHAEPESVETMAKAIGLDPQEWVLRVQADREAMVNPKRAQVWLRCAQRLSGAAATIAITVGLAAFTPTEAKATQLRPADNNGCSYTLCAYSCTATRTDLVLDLVSTVELTLSVLITSHSASTAALLRGKSQLSSS